MPTALELGPEGWKPFVEAARKRGPNTGLTAAQKTERGALVDRVRRAAQEIKTRYEGCRVLLFGSLSHGQWFDATSDVDVAVEGLDGEAYWDAWEVLETHLSNRAVDLVALETASDSLRQAIERSGLEL